MDSPNAEVFRRMGVPRARAANRGIARQRDITQTDARSPGEQRWTSADYRSITAHAWTRDGDLKRAEITAIQVEGSAVSDGNTATAQGGRTGGAECSAVDLNEGA